MENNIQVTRAIYQETGINRYARNPFIEALPKLVERKLEYLNMVSNRPPPPNNELRKRGEVVRLMEMAAMSDIVYSFPAYGEAGLSLDRILRESYVSRNPITALDKQRRQAIASSASSEKANLPPSWKSAALGHMIVAHSGMGKTTFINASLARYPQVLEHDGYDGQHLRCYQIVFVKLAVPFDGTLKSLCHQFFEEIDSILGTAYTRQAKNLRSIALMVNLMQQVATSCSIGLIVVDELQNLRAAAGAGAEIVLSMFSQIIELLGISLVVIGTPAVESVISGSVRNARKLASGGSTILKSMARNSIEWDNFAHCYWEYCYVQQRTQLTPAVKTAWFNSCGGNTALAALSFMLAQKNEIGGREVIDEIAFARASAKDLGFLQPAIRALVSGDESQLLKFDDLIFTKQFKELQTSLGMIAPVAPAKPSATTTDDFEELEAVSKRTSQNNNRKPNDSLSQQIDLPTEDPFVR